MATAIAASARVVNEDIIESPSGISNISEWCKRAACWTRVRAHADPVAKQLPPEFLDSLVSHDEQKATTYSARKTQKIDNGIEAQRRVLAVPAAEWSRIRQLLTEREVLTAKEAGVFKVAVQIPAKLPTDKQSMVLLGVLEKAHSEGIALTD